jgi:hypothetical protein
VIPKYAFTVTVTTVCGATRDRRAKAFETAATAMAYATEIRRNHLTRKVEVTLILDEWTRVEQEIERVS